MWKTIFSRKKVAKHKVASTAEVYQRMLAKWLSNRSEKLSLSVKKFILTGVCLFVGAYAIGLMIGFIQYGTPKQLQISIPTIPHRERNHGLADAELNILKFHRYMDSLGASPKGIIRRDSILKAHPGIMDTIQRLELIIKLNKH